MVDSGITTRPLWAKERSWAGVEIALPNSSAAAAENTITRLICTSSSIQQVGSRFVNGWTTRQRGEPSSGERPWARTIWQHILTQSGLGRTRFMNKGEP